MAESSKSRGRKLWLAAAAALVVAGGAGAAYLILRPPTPRDVFEAIQSASCDGDVAGVFRHIDKRAMRDNLIAKAQRETGVGDGLLGGFVAGAVGSAIDDYWKELEDDINRGPTSSFCVARGVAWNSGTHIVRWVTRSGKLKKSIFEPAGDSWLMVAMENEE